MESKEEDASAKKEDVEIVENEDPNKIMLEDDNDEIEDEETVMSKPNFDDDTSESEIEDNKGDDDQYEPEDNEFVPDEEDSGSEDKLEEYVEEENPAHRRWTQKKAIHELINKENTASSTGNENDDSPSEKQKKIDAWLKTHQFIHSTKTPQP